MELDLQSLFGSMSRAVYTAVLIGRVTATLPPPPPSPRIRLVYEDAIGQPR
jgi:hypothetical protein